jgi:hypothetical protein
MSSSSKPKKSKSDKVKGFKRKNEDSQSSTQFTQNSEYKLDDESNETTEAIAPGAASRNVEKNDEEIVEDEYGAKDYRFVLEKHKNKEFCNKKLSLPEINWNSSRITTLVLSTWLPMATFSWNPFRPSTKTLTIS